MKILIIAALFRPYHRGGAEVVVENIIRTLAPHHEVTILTTKPCSGLSAFFPTVDMDGDIPGVSVLRFFPLNIFSFIHIARHGILTRLVWHFLDIINIHTFFTTRRILKKIQPDIVLTHNVKGIGYTVPMAVQSFCKTPAGGKTRWIHTIHDLGALYPRGLLRYKHERDFEIVSWPVRWYGFLNKHMFGSPPMVVSRSQFFLDYYRARGFFPHSKFIQFTPDVLPRTQRSATAPKNSFHFLFVSQLEEYKGVRVLLDAWQIVRARSLNATLHIVGRGTDAGMVTAAAHADASLIYHGESFTHAERLAELLPTMHAAIVPTIVYENTSLTVLEAMAAGLPVIASAIGGVGEAVTHGVSGLLVPPGNPEALARAMQQMMGLDWSALSHAARTAFRPYDSAGFEEKLMTLIHSSPLAENPL